MPTRQKYKEGIVRTRWLSLVLAVLGFGLSAPASMGADIDLFQVGGGKTSLGGTGDAAHMAITTLISGENEAANLVRVQPVGGLAGGATPLSYISVGTTEDEHAVCTAQCTVYSITAFNANAAGRYLKCFNAVIGSTTPGTSTPTIRLPVPGSTAISGYHVSFPAGLLMSTAMTCWLVTGAADSDVAEVAANELVVLYTSVQ